MTLFLAVANVLIWTTVITLLLTDQRPEKE